MSALRHLKRTVQRANRDTCNHPAPSFTGAWVPGAGNDPAMYRRGKCGHCGTSVTARRTRALPTPTTPEP